MSHCHGGNPPCTAPPPDQHFHRGYITPRVCSFLVVSSLQASKVLIMASLIQGSNEAMKHHMNYHQGGQNKSILHKYRYKQLVYVCLYGAKYFMQVSNDHQQGQEGSTCYRTSANGKLGKEEQESWS